MYQFGSFLLDPGERILSCDGNPLSLTPKAFDTLLCLVRNQGRMLTKDELLKQIWPDTFVEEVNLAVNISTLRKALGDNARDGLYIVTVPGRGYRFVGDVREVVNQGGNGGSPASEGHAQTVGVARELEIRVEMPKTPGAAAGVPATVPRGRALKLAIPAAAVFLIAAIPGGYRWFEENKKRALPTTTGSIVSIAVLPFADLSSQKDQEYFSDGLTEELTNDLAKIPGMRVVARSSAFQFKGKNEDLRSIGHMLGVANILEGSISRQGDHVRIRAELTKVDDGFQLWSETYDRKIGDIFAVQDEIARAATRALQVKLAQGKLTGVPSSERTSSPEAYQAYLRARYFSTRGRAKTDLENALAYTEQAIKLDGKYAPAWALRSYVVDTMADVGLIDPATGFRTAREDAERAIELDSNGAAGYLALAWAQINRDWNWEGAEISLNNAAELEPGSSSILRYRSFLFHARGRLKEAIEFHKKAIEVDPLLASSHSYLASLLYSAGEYEQAETSLQRALELNPQKTYDHFTHGEILLAQGRTLEALEQMRQEPAEMWRLTGEALVYHALGRDRDSDAALKQLVTFHQKYMAYQIAEVYAFRGRPNEAFEWLNRAYQQRDSGLRSVKIDPLLKTLRHDPRYATLLKEMRLAPG